MKYVLLLSCVLFTLNYFLCLYRNACHGSLLTLHEDNAWKTWGGVMAGWDKLGDQEAPENLTPTLQTGDVLQERGLLLPFLSAEQATRFLCGYCQRSLTSAALLWARKPTINASLTCTCFLYLDVGKKCQVKLSPPAQAGQDICGFVRLFIAWGAASVGSFFNNVIQKWKGNVYQTCFKMAD